MSIPPPEGIASDAALALKAAQAVVTWQNEDWWRSLNAINNRRMNVIPTTHQPKKEESDDNDNSRREADGKPSAVHRKEARDDPAKVAKADPDP